MNEPCDVCDGQGVVEVTDEAEQYRAFDECERCGGTGFEPEEDEDA